MARANARRIARANARRIARPNGWRIARPSLQSPAMVSVDAATEVTDELVDAVGRLIPQLSSSPPPGAAELAEIVGSPATSLLVARDETGNIVGTLTLAVFRIPTGVRAWIEDVVVDDSARGAGVGAALTLAALAAGGRRRRQDRRAHFPAVPRGGQPAVPAAGLRAAGDQRVPQVALTLTAPGRCRRGPGRAPI